MLSRKTNEPDTQQQLPLPLMLLWSSQRQKQHFPHKGDFLPHEAHRQLN